MSEYIELVLRLKEAHSSTWQGEPDSYWFAKMLEEVTELAEALFDIHEDIPDHELMQIAAISLNWLEKRNYSIEEIEHSLERYLID